MDHTAKFAADSLHKEYPEPNGIPEDAYMVFVRDGGVCVRTKSDPTIFETLSPDLPKDLSIHAQYLGHREQVPCYALEIPDDLPLPEGLKRSNVRELAGLIPDEEFAIAGLAVHVTDYDRTTRFCGRCGTKTESSHIERAKICPSCNLITYPRISPAIIVLVQNDDSVLMVQGMHAPTGMYSLVAGFVEPGETIEHAVHREVQEEAGVAIKNVRYCASEPWPFPNSLMIGFVAEYDEGDITPDGVEVQDARWFDRNNLPKIPPKLSLTRSLIDHWVSGE